MKYVIISTGYNCFSYAEKHIESLKRINFSGDWLAVCVSDGSTDGTNALVDSIVHENIIGHSFDKNKGAAFCRHKIIEALNLNDEDVILLTGLDDEVKPHILTEVDKQYQQGKWMTYGNWIDERGSTLQREGFNIYFSDEIHKNRDYRKDVYRSTGVNTFKYFLYKRIPENDLKIDGEWIVSTTESEVMFSCLEMCGKDRIGVIDKPIALYNRYKKDRSLNRVGLNNEYAINAGREYKYRIYNEVINRPKREQLINP